MYYTYLYFGVYRRIILQISANFFRITVIHSTRFVDEKSLFHDRSDHECHHVQPHRWLYRHFLHPSEVFSPFLAGYRILVEVQLRKKIFLFAIFTIIFWIFVDKKNSSFVNFDGGTKIAMVEIP